MGSNDKILVVPGITNTLSAGVTPLCVKQDWHHETFTIESSCSVICMLDFFLMWDL